MQDRRQRYLSGTVLGRSGQRALYSEPSLVQVEPLKRSAKRSGAKIVIVNGEPTAMDSLADAVLCGGIGELLPSLIA
jgi:NAD-dependent SIR2 family protein deacetylase